jgi:hypothetical protein
MELIRRQSAIFTVVAVISSAATFASSVRAQAPSSAGEPIVVRRRNLETFTETTPNTELITSGLFTFGIPYVASVIAASQSTRKGDEFLYAPVAGPWLDLGNRDSCPINATCGNETAFKILLVADGVLQGAGALEMVAGFLFPVSHSVGTVESPRIRVVPRLAQKEWGVTALGTF